jgi:large subunit ribosomal protein L1
MKPGKKFREKEKLVEKGKLYSLNEALTLLKNTTVAKFDETVDLAIKLNVDTKKNPSVRGTVSLPGGSGKSKKIAVITRPELVKDAEAAGADVSGSADLADKIKGGFMDFDVLIASPDMMGTIGKLGKVLGPKGLMPNPKAGTVTEDIAKAVKEFKGGKIEFKMDKGGVVHTILGKVSFPEDSIKKNFTIALSAINHAKPSGTKGAFIQSITVSSTMGPGIKIDSREALAEAAG